MSIPLPPPVAAIVPTDGPTLGGPKTAIIERIRVDIKTTLAQVTTGAGWHKTLTVEDRKQRGESSVSDGLTIIYQGEPQPIDSADQQSTEWTIDFGIKFYILQSETDTAAIDTAVNNTRTDIELALCQPATMQRGGLALITEPSGFLAFEAADGEFAGGVVFVRVQYATNFADGFTSSYGV